MADGTGAGQPRDALDRYRQEAGLSHGELFLRYFELGGMSTALEVEAFLYGALEASAHDREVIAHALNERFVELGGDPPVPYAEVRDVPYDEDARYGELARGRHPSQLPTRHVVEERAGLAGRSGSGAPDRPARAPRPRDRTMTARSPMQLGMVGLGRTGANIARRLVRDGHSCVVFDVDPEAVDALEREGATAARSVAGLVEKLAAPRAVWVMVPAGEITARTIADLAVYMAAGDTIIDGGDSDYRDDIRRAAGLADKGIHLVDCGTSGGVWGIDRGYCLMLGGDTDVVERLGPVFATVAPGMDSVPRTVGRTGEPDPAEHGYLRCGPHGAGHFVKMVHSGIEHAMMASLAEGLDILHNADAGHRCAESDAETAPLDEPESYRFAIDTTAVAELWRRGSVIESLLLDLTVGALVASPTLEHPAGRASGSGEGRWTSIAAIDEGVPAPVLTAALYSRFASRDLGSFADKVLSAMREGVGGHEEREI